MTTLSSLFAFFLVTNSFYSNILRKLPENGLYTQFNHRKADGVFITQRLFRNSTKKLTTLSF